MSNIGPPWSSCFIAALRFPSQSLWETPEVIFSVYNPDPDQMPQNAASDDGLHCLYLGQE